MNKKQSAVILGAQWGDEGKGKIVDVLSEKFNVVARYAGGHNAGHTVIIAGKKFVLQLIPCGVLRPGCKGVIGNGVVLDPMAFLNEVKKLKDAGLPIDGAALRLQPRPGHPALPPHDRARRRERARPHRTSAPPAAASALPTKTRCTATACASSTCSTPRSCARTSSNACHEKNTIAHALFGTEPLDPKQMYEEYAAHAEQVAPFVTDTAVLLNEALDEGENVMFEGAQGALLDIDHGTYPFVTCSSATAGGAVTGTGVGPTAIGTVIGVTKAYVTRVGEGPFPTEISRRQPANCSAPAARSTAPSPAARAAAAGSTCPLLRYSNMINWHRVARRHQDGRPGRAATRSPSAPPTRSTASSPTSSPPTSAASSAIEPIYTTLKGWNTSTEGITEFDKLPKAAQDYLHFHEKESGAKIGMVSTGPDRDQTMTVNGFDQALC